MKQNSLFLTIFLLFLLPNVSKAQNEWLSGYVIKTNRDTLVGYIENRGNKSNSFECHFRITPDAETNVYRPTEIYGYRFINGEFFISKKVNDNEQVFLEFLINGKVKLYHLGDKKERYFVEKDTMFYELLNTEEVVLNSDYVKYLRRKKEYLGILSHFMNDGNMTSEISTLPYSAKSLINITKDYHEKVCPNEECLEYKKSFAPVHLAWGPIAGVTFNQIKFGGMITSKMAVGSAFGARLELENLVHWIERFSLIVDLSIQKFTNYQISSNGSIRKYLYYNETEYWSDINKLDVNIKTTLFKAPIIMNYYFSKGALRPYIGLGYMNMFVLSQNKDFVFEPFYSRYNQSIPDYNFGLIGLVGAKLKLKNTKFVFCEFKYEYTQTSDLQADYKFKNKLLGFSVGLSL